MKFIMALTITLMMVFSIEAAADTVKIRLAEAHNQTPPTTSTSLKDVEGLLKGLRYNSFTLIASSSLPLPANQKVRVGQYTLECKGDKTKLEVTIYKNNVKLMKSNVIFRGKPVIIGGLPGKKGKHFFIFTK